MSGPALESAIFTAAGATVARRFDEYAAADVVNVKNYGAIGNGIADDRAVVQAAIDAAFGPANAPHGTNSSLNKALFFPSGLYKCSDELVLTKVKRGRIFGSVSSFLKLADGSTNKKLLRVNGCEDTMFENFGLDLRGCTSCVGLDLDWDNVGSVGLSHNTFRKIGAGASDHTTSCTGFRIANSGNGGAGNSFWNCISEFIDVGFHVVGANAFSQTFQGICGGSESNICWKVDGGSIGTITGVSNAGTNIQTDIQINNASTISVQGVRSEASWFVELNASGAKALIAGAGFGSTGHTGPQQNIKMAPGTTLILDVVNTYSVVATSPGTTPKPIIYKRGGVLSVGFLPGPSSFTFLQDI